MTFVTPRPRMPDAHCPPGPRCEKASCRPPNASFSNTPRRRRGGKGPVADAPVHHAGYKLAGAHVSPPRSGRCVLRGIRVPHAGLPGRLSEAVLAASLSIVDGRAEWFCALSGAKATAWSAGLRSLMKWAIGWARNGYWDSQIPVLGAAPSARPFSRQLKAARTSSRIMNAALITASSGGGIRGRAVP